MIDNIKRKAWEFVKGLDVLTFVMIGVTFLLFFFAMLNMKGMVAFKYASLITFLIILPVSVVIHFICWYSEKMRTITQAEERRRK